MVYHRTVPARLAALLVTLGVVVGCLTACASGSDSGSGPGSRNTVVEIAPPAADCGSPQPLGIVVSPHANSPAPAVDAQLSCLLHDAIEAGFPVIVVSVDGDPDLVFDEPVVLDDANETVREDSLGETVDEVARAVLGARPDSDGADLLAAIDLAAEALRGAAATDGRLVVTTPGLPDTGLLDMTLPGMLAADPVETATFVRQQSGLDLRPYDVVLRGVGTTTAPQAALAPVDRDAVEAILSTLMEKSGAAVEIVPLPSAEPSVDTEHSVVPTTLPDRAVLQLDTRETLTFDQSRLEFASNSVRLVRPHDAAEAIAPVCEWLRSDASRSATFTGTTATAGTPEGRRVLSARRARAAADLCDGVDPSRITIIGAGTDDPSHVPDLDAAGNLVPHLAAQNRTVRVELHD